MAFVLRLYVSFYFHFETTSANRKISIRFEGKITILHKFNLAVDSKYLFFYDWIKILVKGISISKGIIE